MIIGVISDTHDKLPTIQAALELFSLNNALTVIHCGDWKTAETVTYFAEEAQKRAITVHSVFGNRDVAREEILLMNSKLPSPIQIKADEIREFLFKEQKMVAYHGHHKPTLKRLIESNSYDVIFTGHTHKPKIERINKTLIINPGSTAFMIPRQKNSKPSVALYETETREAQIITF